MGGDPVPELIIGHTTDSSATIWVRGDEKHALARVTLHEDGSSRIHSHRPDVIRLSARSDFTDVARFGDSSSEELRSGTKYCVRARFAATEAQLEDGAAEEVEGTLQTFPDPAAEPEPFCFLHGACNLSVVGLTNLGAFLAGAGGALMGRETRKTPLRGKPFWDRILKVGDWIAWQSLRVYRWIGRLRGADLDSRLTSLARSGFSIVDALFFVLYQRSGFKQPRPMLPSPFRELTRAISEQERQPAFMIHAGDQIYFDFPEPRRKPQVAEYRLAYREAWFEDEELKRFFRSCPQYMTLDDHDIVESFPDIGSDGPDGVASDERVRAYREAAIPVYREYVHSRQPQDHEPGLYYEFQHGRAHFFVLDTRNERKKRSPAEGEAGAWDMISGTQMQALRDWLKEHPKELKFVVSSVPFVAEISPDARSPDDRRDADDKWCGKRFQDQREEIIELLMATGNEKLVFLVGDMHCAYHARMQIGWPQRRITVHELAGGPTYQLQFSRRKEFLGEHRATTRRGGVPYRSWLGAFYGAASGVLALDVDRDSKVRWRLLRTSPQFKEERETRGLRRPDWDRFPLVMEWKRKLALEGMQVAGIVRSKDFEVPEEAESAARARSLEDRDVTGKICF
jgi:PhoD-like phosphatase